MSQCTPEWVTNGIAEILTPWPKEKVIPSRYPNTYAYDLLRTHQTQFGITPGEPMMSRSEAGAWLSMRLNRPPAGDPTYRHVCEVLADAYIRFHNLTWRGVEA